MTVGEKLLHLRKQNNLSQEELAKRLLVSRQTISLWETNQSFPTIENLCRLREIFGVSVDEILLPSEHAHDPQPALQTFEYTLTSEDYQTCFRVCNHKFLRNNRLTILFGVLSLIAAWIMTELGSALFIIGVFFICMALRNLKELNQQKANLPTHSPAFRWELYETDFSVSVYRDGKLSHYIRSQYSDIDQSWRYEDRIALLLKNTLYILPAASVTANTPLLPTIQQKLAGKNDKTRLENWALALFWATIAAPFLSSWIALSLPDLYGGFITEYMWLMWLVLPVPIACVALGFVMKKRGLAWKKNVICGFIIAALLLLFGSYTFIFRPIEDDADTYIVQIEQKMDMDFPDSGEYYLSPSGGYSSGNDQILLLSRLYGYYNGYGRKELNARLATDDRWLSDIPYHLLPCIPLNDVNPDADYFLLFDATDNTFNTMPQGAGTHILLYITYSADYGSLNILEYEYICN